MSLFWPMLGLLGLLILAWSVAFASDHKGGLRGALATLRLAGSPQQPCWATGQVQGADIAVQVTPPNEQNHFVLTIHGPTERQSLLTFDRAGLFSSSNDLQIGDPVFDAAVLVTGVVEQLAVVGDPATRDAIVAAVNAGARWTGTRWEARFEYVGDIASDTVVAVVRAIADAHVRLSAGLARDRRAALQERLSDRSAAVRRKVLAYVLGEGGADLAPCLRDLDPEIRITAAEALEAWPVLLDVARTGSRSWRVRAATSLVARNAPLTAAEVATVEDVLIRALPDPELVAAAAEALGRVGTRAAIAPLDEAIRTAPQAGRSAARDAVAQIRARLAPHAGGLALVDGPLDGALSVHKSDVDEPGD